MAKKLLHIIGAFVVKFVPYKNGERQFALYEKGGPINDV